MKLLTLPESALLSGVTSMPIVFVASFFDTVKVTPAAMSSNVFELLVAAMLIALGGRAVVRARPDRSAAADAQMHVARRLPALRPVIVGAVHGLAGSGALVALATAGLPTVSARVAFIGLFGFGSIAAMSAISGLAGWPLARVARRPAAARVLLTVAGTTSIALGVAWAWNPLHALVLSCR